MTSLRIPPLGAGYFSKSTGRFQQELFRRPLCMLNAYAASAVTREVIIDASIENIVVASGPTSVTVYHPRRTRPEHWRSSEICPLGEVVISRRPRPGFFKTRAELLA